MKGWEREPAFRLVQKVAVVGWIGKVGWRGPDKVPIHGLERPRQQEDGHDDTKIEGADQTTAYPLAPRLRHVAHESTALQMIVQVQERG
jgi:hypothetical protein